MCTCVSLCGFVHVSEVSVKAKRGHQIHCNGVTGSCNPMCMLGVELRFSARTVHSLNCQAISQPPNLPMLIGFPKTVCQSVLLGIQTVMTIG